jgi:hypothetical protein
MQSLSQVGQASWADAERAGSCYTRRRLRRGSLGAPPVPEVLMSAKSPCGSHTELTSNNAVRVTRCACGTMHVTFLTSGVTVRMSSEVFRNVSSGFTAAAERMDERADFSSTGSTSIN